MEIRVENLRKTFQSDGGVVTALNDVTLDVPDGSVTTLLGPSGCGKTTLLRCIAGLETPDSGTIRIGDAVVWEKNGERITSVSPDKRGIGMVFQTYAIWPHMTVFENVAYPLQSQGVPRADIAGRVARALEFVQLGGYEKRPATALSGGQQQRVSLARAIVSEPRVILFDEPLSNLDAKLREETRAELRELLNRLAITSLYVTHDRFEALALSDDVVVMQSGNIVQRGAPEEVYFRSNTQFVVDFMGKANFLPATVADPEHEGGYLLADTAVGPLLCERRAGLVAGQQGEVAVRMEFLEVVPDEVVPEPAVAGGASNAGGSSQGGEPAELPANHVAATVTSVTFLGEYQEVDALAGDVKLHLRVAATAPLEEGQDVTLRFVPAGCRFITE